MPGPTAAAAGPVDPPLPDDDDSDENKAKFRYAKEHFERVSEAQDAARYSVKFVSPISYDAFFQALRDGTVVAYESALQARLLE